MLDKVAIPGFCNTAPLVFKHSWVHCYVFVHEHICPNLWTHFYYAVQLLLNILCCLCHKGTFFFVPLICCVEDKKTCTSWVFYNLVVGGNIQNLLVRLHIFEMAADFIKKKKKNSNLLLLCHLRNLDFCPL